MKRMIVISRLYRYLFAGVMAAACFTAKAADVTSDILVSEVSMTRNGSLMSVAMDLGLSVLDLGMNKATVITPMVVNDADTLMLPAVGVYGRIRWYQFERSGSKPVNGNEQTSLRYAKDMPAFEYRENFPYQEWMNGSQLILMRADYGCAGCNAGTETLADLAGYRDVIYKPVFLFQEAVAEQIKTRELKGRAFVDFPVNKIVIYPEYRNNTHELGKIIATIDSVKNDKDITVTSIFIKGTASPEGPYDNNVYLAKNRTIALKQYVSNLYNFPDDFIKTDYNPVDWPGLREWLESSNIAHRDEILALVNSDIESYERNSRIKKDFPEEYDWLLRNVYPALRHSDYVIEYMIRQFSDVKEIAEVMRTAPQKLSLNEMYLLAGSLEPGSDEYNEVFETAVRMYPNDEAANINAANSAMMRKDYANAEKYLAKAGSGAKAIYARGVLAGLQGDFDNAIRLVDQAQAMGLQADPAIIENLHEAAKFAR